MRHAATALFLLAVAAWAVAAAAGAAGNARGSDVVRQWVVCQYVHAGLNPYALARGTLEAKYGPGNPNRTRIYAVPGEAPPHLAGQILEWGPPEATYPPPAVGMLALTVGMLPSAGIALWVWFALNLAAAVWVVLRLAKLYPVPPGGRSPGDGVRLVALAVMLFPAAHNTFAAGQFSLLVLALLLVSDDPAVGRLPRGLALGVALIKPSVALPFALLPLVRREWRVLIAAAAVQGIAAGYVALKTGKDIELFRDWLAVAGYFLQGGIYTAQDWLAPLLASAPKLGSVAALGFLALCGATLVACRSLPRERLFGVAAATSAFWTYHGDYDFVVLLPVLLAFAGWSARPPSRPWSGWGLLVFAVLGLALTQLVIRGDEPWARAARWAGRLAVLGLTLREYARAWRDGYFSPSPER